MKDFKGTQGEWKRESNRFDRFEILSKGLNILSNDVPFGDQESNANLIAAAPELLEALQECQKFMVEAGSIEAANQYVKNMDLINKALGL